MNIGNVGTAAYNAWMSRVNETKTSTFDEFIDRLRATYFSEAV